MWVKAVWVVWAVKAGFSRRPKNAIEVEMGVESVSGFGWQSTHD